MSAKDLSTWEWNDVKEWLSNNKMDQYIPNFQKCQVNGYDLCYLANEDFNEMGITNFHSKNIILKSIRTLTLEQLKLKISYESKMITVQLDFDPSFTVDVFANELRELFHIQNKIYLTTTYDNEILMPNLKIVELILLNPSKYKQIKILNERDVTSSDYSLQKTKQVYSSNYSLYEKQQPSLYNANQSTNTLGNKDIEKDYLNYRDSKLRNNNTNTSTNITNLPISDSTLTSNPINNQIPDYKSVKSYGRDFQRPYTPNNPVERINDNNSTPNTKLPGSLYDSKKDYLYSTSTPIPNQSSYEPSTSTNALRNNTPNYRREDPLSYYGSKNSPELNMNNTTDDTTQPQSSYVPNYMQYNPSSTVSSKPMMKDSKKYASEKRFFRMGDNSDMNDVQLKPAIDMPPKDNIPRMTNMDIGRMNNTGMIGEKYSSYGIGTNGSLSIGNNTQYEPMKNKTQKPIIRQYDFEN